MYILQSFGIPVDYIPVSFTGKVKEKYIKEWMRLRKFIEDERLSEDWTPESKSSMIESPYLDDVVFRNGTSLLSHPGNIALRSIIAAKSVREENKDKNTKELVSETISEIKGRTSETGGDGESKSRRFLIWNEKGWWKAVPPENEPKEIHSKISRIVRDTRKLVMTNQKKAQLEAKAASESSASNSSSNSKLQKPMPFSRTDDRDRGTYMFVQSNANMSQKRQKLSPNRDCFGFQMCDTQLFCSNR
jgi:hypothetical protein